MPEYRTPLPQLFAATLEAGVNQVLGLDTSAAGRLRKLEGRVLQLEIEGLGITLYFTAGAGTVHITLEADGEPDTVISGTPLALFAMAAPGDAGSWGLPESRVRISGDANLARDLEQVFSRLDPDWEGPLASLFGDVLGFQFAAGLKHGAEAVRGAVRSTMDATGAYFRDEESMLVRPGEFRSFAQELGALDEAVGRLAARLGKLQEGEQ